MAGYSSAGHGAEIFIQRKLYQRKVVLFVKKHCSECNDAKEMLSIYKLSPDDYEVCEIGSRQDCSQIEDWFHYYCLLDSRAVPQLFVRAAYVGGIKEMREYQKSGELDKIIHAASAHP